MDDFWDGILETAVYQIEIDEHSGIKREYYSIAQAIEYLRVKFPTEYFDNVSIADLIDKGKLELVASFTEEIDLANVLLMSDDEIKEKPYFMGDYGLQYKLDTVVSSHNSLSAFKLVATSQGGQEAIGNIVHTIKGKYLPHNTTKYDVLLFREDKFWKVVDVAFDEEYEIRNSPRCFLDYATWGISAESLEGYCSNLMAVTDDESKDEKVKRWKKMRFEEKLKLREVIEKEDLKISISELQRLTGSKSSYARNKYKIF